MAWALVGPMPFNVSIWVSVAVLIFTKPDVAGDETELVLIGAGVAVGV